MHTDKMHRATQGHSPTWWKSHTTSLDIYIKGLKFSGAYEMEMSPGNVTMGLKRDAEGEDLRNLAHQLRSKLLDMWTESESVTVILMNVLLWVQPIQ